MEIEIYAVMGAFWLACLVYFNHRSEEHKEYPIFYPMFSYNRLEKTKRRDKFMVSFLVCTVPVLFSLIHLVAYWNRLPGYLHAIAILYICWWVGIAITWTTSAYRWNGSNMRPGHVNAIVALSALFGVWLVPYMFSKMLNIRMDDTTNDQAREDTETIS